MIAYVTRARYACLCCYLWDDGESRSQVLKSNLRNINTINNNSSSSSLQDAEQSQSQRGFASTSATNDTNLREKNNLHNAYHQVTSLTKCKLVILAQNAVQTKVANISFELKQNSRIA